MIRIIQCRKRWTASVTLAMVLVFIAISHVACAQPPCPGSARVEGVVTDPTGSVLPGATVHTDDGIRSIADSVGHFNLCIGHNTKTITVEGEGFAPRTRNLPHSVIGTLRINFQLQLATASFEVHVGPDPNAVDPDHGSGTTNLTTQDVNQLADDPDDFQRQLQMLAAGSGGQPGNATITVDGFQNASALPPKSSIASIRVNPDLFSAEYASPPFGGGRVEIFTKPGLDSFHGALFFIDSDGSFNATDPFSLTATPAGKRRYGFELSGPITRKSTDFSLALEKRDIDEFNIVNAVTLDSEGNQIPFHQTVEAPQRLWIASTRGDWQVTRNDTASLSFAANVNNLTNQGVGGLVLPEAGYSNLVSEYDLRFTNAWTLNANLLDQIRIGFTWKRTEQTPVSTSPSLQVAGFFTGGGATSQNLDNRQRNLEIDDDVMLTRGRHSIKLGVQALGVFVHDYDPDTFNGAYVFGGGSAPELDANNQPTGQTTTLTPIEQYQRAFQNLPGGSPTTFQLTSGNPLVPFSQWQFGLYLQDTVKITQHVTLAGGLRYAFQTSPGTFANFGPRAGISWAPDKKETWVLHLRAGLFSEIFSQAYATQAYRLNGVRQQETLVYSPNYANPLVPTPQSTAVSTRYQFPHSFEQLPSVQVQFSIEHEFPHHWHPQASITWGGDWGVFLTKNINAPLVASSIGSAPDPAAALLATRPFTPNENIFEYQNSGHLNGNVLYLGLDQHSYKRFGLHIGYVHVNFKSDGGTGAVTPQSTYSTRGESSRPDWQMTNRVFVVGNLNLPKKLQWAVQFDADTGQPYNLTTGTDSNGDGTFNDRPSYGFTQGPGVYNTPFGLLTTNTVNGNVPRNIGTMPTLVHMDMNLSRAFALNPKSKEHPTTLTFNARSANVLNHTNVTAVNTVLSSSAVGQSISAEAARRVELGVRFTF